MSQALEADDTPGGMDDEVIDSAREVIAARQVRPPTRSQENASENYTTNRTQETPQASASRNTQQEDLSWMSPGIRQTYDRWTQEVPGATWRDIQRSYARLPNASDELRKRFIQDAVESRQARDIIEGNVSEVEQAEKYAKNLSEMQEVVEALVQREKFQADKERQGYRQEAREDVTQDFQGLTDQQRRALQESANAQINKMLQSEGRRIASASGGRGVRGGTSIAPQIDLSRRGLEAQSQVQRDLVERDTDLAMRRLAAYLANIEGRSAQQLLRRGQFLDYVTGRQQQGREAAMRKYMENLFGRVR
jgi:hypothetical protein